MDVWMKRAMAQLFPKGFPRYLRGYEGLAQQFLFHYCRLCPGALKSREGGGGNGPCLKKDKCAQTPFQTAPGLLY